MELALGSIVTLLLILLIVQYLFYAKNIKKITDKTRIKEEIFDDKEQLTDREKVADKEQELEDEIVKLKAIVEDTKVIAQEATIIKSDFLTNIRHEIRTPMNAILVFSEMIQKESQDKDIASYAKDIYFSGSNLLHLFNNIIEMSEIDSGHFKISTTAVDMKQFIDRVVEVHKFSSIKKGLNFIIKLDENIPESIMIDEGRVQEILDNLLENALKFTYEGEIKFVVSLNRFNDSKHEADMSFTVTDTGIGISPVNQEKIFNIFENKHTETKTEYQSSGLSLSLNKKLASMMNGSLEVQSELNVGSTFTLSLQDVEVLLMNNSYEIEDSKLNFSSINQASSILVVDESQKTLELVRESFKNTDIVLYAFNSFKDAIGVLQKQKVDLILIDIDILSMDESAVSIVINQISKAPIVGLVDDRLNHISLHEYAAKPLTHLKKPLNKVDLFRIALKVINGQESVVENGLIQELSLNQGLNFEANKEASSTYFKNMPSEVDALLQQSLDTNDLRVIESLAKKIYERSLEYNVENLLIFSQELLVKVDSFDIAEIDRMLKEYDKKSKDFKDHYLA